VWGEHTCALDPGGVAYCWGSNIEGKLGVGTTVGPQDCSGAPCSMQPAPVAGALRFTGIGVGEQHTCALSTAGTVFCWGVNDLGQLGNGTTTGRTTPGAVSGGRAFVSLSVGARHSCALTSDGTAYCWGYNFSGQLGRLTSVEWGGTPAAVTTSLRFSAISAGGAHTCGIATDGETYCWGDNGSGQLGTGTTSLAVTAPTRVAGGLTFGEVSAGGSHTCGLTPAGVAYCWGENADGSLGDGTGERRNVPTKVAGQP
jgi:alpha-tubulin suppressor-like RCC1 family protein